jgi:PEGA domain
VFAAPPDAARDREANDDSSPANRHNMGVLSLAIRPRDAAIYIDGEPDSGAAREDVELRAGTHHIEVVRPGYQPFARDVTIEPGKTSEIDIHLDTK